MLTFWLASSLDKCALHTVGVPVINYGDVKNVWIFKQ